MDTKQWIADKIKSRLWFLKISKKELAQLANVSPSDVTKWISGNHNFTVDTLLLIERTLNFNLFAYNESDGYNNNKPCAPCVINDIKLYIYEHE